jgi:hypothetical protein
MQDVSCLLQRRERRKEPQTHDGPAATAEVNEAADQFTDALVQSYKTLAERGVSAQEGSAQVTEVFFNQTINNLRAQAEETRQASGQLAEQQQRQADAAQTLTQESVGAYMAFVD